MRSVTLAADADSAAVADVLTRLEADAAGLPAETTDRLLLVAGELIANACDHGTDATRVAWGIAGAEAWFRVAGGPSAADVARATLPDAAAVRGRGLFLARALADALVDHTDGLEARFTPRAP